MTVVISQSMYFPWAGLLEQVLRADVFVHYDDVQFTRGSHTNRVQVKTAGGVRWLTVPLADVSLGTRICDIRMQPLERWVMKHIRTLEQSYAKAPSAAGMLALVEEVFAAAPSTLAELSRASLRHLCRALDIGSACRFLDSSELCIGGHGSERVLGIVKALGGTVYLTGWGARDYLRHEDFEAEGIEVRYMDYRIGPYPQLHGDFTPFVSALDLLANCGAGGRAHLHSQSLPWREFVR